MKQLLLIVLFSLVTVAFAQDDKTVTLIVSGQGKTQDEAKQAALRNAIEQAFGVFISSKTEILSDNLIKDEVISLSNGNIQKFDILSEAQLPNGVFSSTLRADVAISKLSSFIESKGFNVEIKGSLFAFNIEQQKLMEESEYKCVKNFVDTYGSISKMIYDYTISKNGEPQNSRGDNWIIPLVVEVKFNKNVDLIKDNLFKMLNSISLTNKGANDYLQLNKNVYPVCISITKDKNDYFVLRNEQSVLLLNKFLGELFSSSSESFCIYTNNNTNCLSYNYTTPKTLGRYYVNNDGWSVLKNPYYDNKEFVNKVVSENGLAYVMISNIEIKNYNTISRDLLHNQYSNVGGYSKSLFSQEHLKFIKKLEKNLLTSKNQYNSMNRFDNLFVGYVFSLQEAIPSSVFYKFYFNDNKSLSELKNIGSYLVKSK